MTDAVRDMVEGLAAEGWLTVAPHLYHRDDADEIGEDDSDRVRDQVDRLDSGEVLADTDTAFGWLADREVTADRMGVLGFDIGAAVALLVAGERTLGAAVSVADEGSMTSVSGQLPSPTAAMAALTCPWLGLYGRTGDGDGDTATVRDTSAAEFATNVAGLRAAATASTPTRTRPPTRGSARWTGSTLICDDATCGDRGLRQERPRPVGLPAGREAPGGFA